MIPPKETSPSSESSLAKTNDPVEDTIEKELLINAQADNTDPTVSDVQTNMLEYEKINVPSSVIYFVLLSAEKAKDYDEISLSPPKPTYLSVDTSLAKTNVNNKMSIKKNLLTESKTDNTEPTVSNV